MMVGTSMDSFSAHKVWKFVKASVLFTRASIKGPRRAIVSSRKIASKSLNCNGQARVAMHKKVCWIVGHGQELHVENYSDNRGSCSDE